MKITEIAEEDRLDFLPKYIPNPEALTFFEGFVFNYAKEHIKEYDGGYWDFYEVELDDGRTAPLMVWDSEEKEVNLKGNFEDFKTDSFTASLSVFNTAQNHFAFGLPQGETREMIAEQWEVLREWAFASGDKRLDVSVYAAFTD